MYSSATGETRVGTEIHLLVKVAFFTVFAFSHRSEETWRDGQADIADQRHRGGWRDPPRRGCGDARTDFAWSARAVPFIASAATLTSNSLWTPAVLEQATVVDAQHGGIIGVSARKLADEEIAIAGRPIRATRYTLITPYLAGSIWYDEDRPLGARRIRARRLEDPVSA